MRKTPLLPYIYVQNIYPQWKSEQCYKCVEHMYRHIIILNIYITYKCVFIAFLKITYPCCLTYFLLLSSVCLTKIFNKTNTLFKKVHVNNFAPIWTPESLTFQIALLNSKIGLNAKFLR